MKKIFTLLSAVSMATLVSACCHNGGAPAAPDEASMQKWNAAQQEHMRRVSEYFFDEMDTNQDGTVSYKEFINFQRKIFKEADANHDGKLTLEEFIGEGKRQKNRIHEWKEEHQGEERDEHDGDRAQGRGDEQSGGNSDARTSYDDREGNEGSPQ